MTLSVKILPVLGNGLLSLEGVLSPDSLGVDELALPWLNVAVQVRNELIFFMTHSRPEVGDPHVCLLRPPGNQRHNQMSQLFRNSEQPARDDVRTAGLTVG